MHYSKKFCTFKSCISNIVEVRLLHGKSDRGKQIVTFRYIVSKIDARCLIRLYFQSSVIENQTYLCNLYM